MIQQKYFRLVLPLVLAGMMGCAHGDCNNIPQRPSPSPSPSPTPTPSPTPVVSPTPTPVPVPRGRTVDVYKPTGERQCGQGAGVPLDEMKLQLTKRKIKVFESRSQADGLMHMALCGAPTGNIHVFTIPANQEKRALRLGFKVLQNRGE